ncbi:MAG: hypothetical protein NXI02_08600 [Rhodobacteraceae bacterium]|nr:hypothetical protein [Paracoccaceae bacterium]
MSEIFLQRRLWFTDQCDRVAVDQDFLKNDSRSLVVLGEAGMGKSTLLGRLRDIDGFAVCTARKLIVTPDPKSLIGESKTLVVDALDEVSAQHEGDAVNLVLRRLAELGLPRFILSCRVADWRSATALQGFADFYDCAPLELHLEPLDRDDAITFLAVTLGDTAAEEAIDHLVSRGLSGLWSNPQTLELVKKVAEQGKLPLSKGELFSDATKLLRAEHRREKSTSPLASLPEASVVDATGAGFAALILTGKEALSREVYPEETDAALAEISALPGADRIDAVVDSRLFEARAPERFTYAHRAIGEFLGARWLAEQADTARKRRRLLELFNNHALVPANLRGIHAWLAWHSPALASQVIIADPMGVIEYGDADTLSPAQGRALLSALLTLSSENPRFRDWSEYLVGGLVQPALLPEVRQVVTNPSVEFGLRLLILQALRASDLVSVLHEELMALLLNTKTAFALRREAGDRLVELGGSATDWPNVIEKLIGQGSENSVRLASELMNEVGYDRFDDALVIDTVKAQLNRTEHTVGVFRGLERNLPDHRINTLLDGIVATTISIGDRHSRRLSDAVTDLAFALLARRLAGTPPDASKLWHWLRPFDSRRGVHREARKAVADVLLANDGLRRAVQRHVFLELESEENIWQRAWHMPALGLQPSEDDVLWLLDQLDRSDPRWREIVQLSRHGPDEGARIRAAAKRFMESNPEDQAWLEQLAEPHVPEWQIEQEQQERERKAEREAEWKLHRTEFTIRIEAMRAGDYGGLVNPAKAYLNLFYDIGEERDDGPGRIEEWLGPELRDAALTGFEAFLTAEPPMPTAKDIADSHAESRHWDAAYIIVAALAERSRTGQGYDDLPIERLLAGYIELSQTRINDQAGIGDLDVQLENVLRARREWEAAKRLLCEPQLALSVQNVTGLYDLLRSAEDTELVDRLSAEWLARFPDMSYEAEREILDRLLSTPAGRGAIRNQLPKRLEMPLSNERRLVWDAVGLILDFETTCTRLKQAGPIDSDLLWVLRARAKEQNRMASPVSFDAKLLAWTIRTFRNVFPFISRPGGVTSGDTNPWDATEYLVALINRLGDDITHGATEALVALRDAPADGYTEHLKVAVAEQKRKRVEAEWKAPDLLTVIATITDQAPTTAPQLQAVMLEELDQVQAKIRGSSLNWYKDFFGDSAPKGEEECRDTILKMFGELPFGIQASPEGHLADDKRCDIECMLPGIMVPIELKGQWHKDLWTSADRQLDLLYTNDWRAERGIYVVLWFGHVASKKPCRPPAGVDPPMTAEALRKALAAQSATTREGRTEIVVLDLTRPA